MRAKKICESCGLNHRALGVTFKGDALHRRVTRDNQRGIQGGGFWAFDVALIERHPEVRRLFVWDAVERKAYAVERETFDRFAVCKTMGAKVQRVLYFRYWRIVERDKTKPNGGAVASSSVGTSHGAAFIQSRLM